MKKYNVKILEDAKNDMKNIVSYIKDKLIEPDIAKRHREAFKEAIIKLSDNADIYNPIDNEITGKSEIRKVNVKNFMIFYRIIKEINEVQIIAVFYSGSLLEWDGAFLTKLNERAKLHQFCQKDPSLEANGCQAINQP